jgi:hypothetical protein
VSRCALFVLFCNIAYCILIVRAFHSSAGTRSLGPGKKGIQLLRLFSSLFGSRGFRGLRNGCIVRRKTEKGGLDAARSVRSYAQF